MTEELIHEGKIFDFVKLDGKYDAIVRHPGAVFIVPVLNIHKNEIVVIHSFRPALNQTVLELPAGLIDPGEMINETASRELLEETGYSAGRLIPLGGPYYSSYGYSDEKVYFFAALDLELTGKPDGEASKVFTISARLAMQQILSATGMLCLMLYFRARAEGKILERETSIQ